jgi:hypothetical protein
LSRKAKRKQDRTQKKANAHQFHQQRVSYKQQQKTQEPEVVQKLPEPKKRDQKTVVKVQKAQKQRDQ